MHCSCIGVCQIRPEIWPKPNLAEFGKNGRISAWPKPKPKFGATLMKSTESESTMVWNFRSRERKFQELSLSGTFTPYNIRSRERKLGAKESSWNFCSLSSRYVMLCYAMLLELLFPGTFAP